VPKPTAADVARLAESLKRSKEVFSANDRPGLRGESSARAYGYLEMAVERFLESGKRKAVRHA